MQRNSALRSAIAFFLLTFSTAFLGTVGARLTGWFTQPPDLARLQSEALGISIIVGVITLAVGASVRRMDASELRSALLGAGSVLLAIPTSAVAIFRVWPVSWTVISVLGVILLAVGFVVAATSKAPAEVHHE